MSTSFLLADRSSRTFPPLSVLCLPVYAGVAAYALAVSAALVLTGSTQAFAFKSYFVVWPVTFFVVFPAIYALLLLLRIVHRFETRRGRMLAIRKSLAAPHLIQFTTGLGLLAAMMVFQGAFSSFKTALPIWRDGFPDDIVQANIDRAIHFGVDPWRLLYAIGQNDVVRAVAEWNYNQAWFIFCYAILFFVAVSGKAAAVRSRYLVTYMLVWIIVGNILAGLFLSAGPAFYGLVTGDTARFGEQLAFLAASGDSTHSAARVQAYLWNFYQSGNAGLGSGISAFPSMHVGLVTLNALFIFEASRKWGIIAFAYVGFVLASSVYLAWHYAIDGYAAIVVTIIVFLAVRKAFRLKAS